MGLFSKKEPKRIVKTKSAMIIVLDDSRGYNKVAQSSRTMLQSVNGEVYFKDKFEKGNLYFLDKFDWNQDMHSKDSTGIIYLTNKDTSESFTLSLNFSTFTTDPVYLKTFITK
ncbi:MAG: hypothetical protein WBA84_06675 [Carnobacterium sp.]|uniref:hypothetical protein n=1 Tax=Carnobacterium sp. TaxID=48221 RepID=UPI003C73FB7D